MPIPFTAILKYSRIYDVDDFEEFKGIIQRMDNTLLKLHANAMEKKRQTTEKKEDGPKHPNASNQGNGQHKRK